MKKSKKIYKRLLLIVAILYVAITLVNQQKVLNTYKQNQQELSKEIKQEEEYKQELAQTKENVNSLDYIEQVAREKLGMYLPNERLYIDISK